MIDVWIQKVLAGESDTFRFIIQEYKDQVYTLAFSVLKNEADAKDTTQETFIKAYKNLDSFRGEAAFSTWLHRIVINEALRKKEKMDKKQISMDEVSKKKGSLTKDKNEILSKIKANHQSIHINDALLQIQPNYSLALRLFYLEEYSVKEVAGITEWTISNTKVILHRARKSLKKTLVEDFNLNKEELY